MRSCVLVALTAAVERVTAAKRRRAPLRGVDEVSEQMRGQLSLLWPCPLHKARLKILVCTHRCRCKMSSCVVAPYRAAGRQNAHRSKDREETREQGVHDVGIRHQTLLGDAVDRGNLLISVRTLLGIDDGHRHRRAGGSESKLTTGSLGLTCSAVPKLAQRGPLVERKQARFQKVKKLIKRTVCRAHPDTPPAGCR